MRDDCPLAQYPVSAVNGGVILIIGIQLFHPDVLVIDMNSQDDYIFNKILEINKINTRPIVFFYW